MTGHQLEFFLLWPYRDLSTHVVSPTPSHVHTTALLAAGLRGEVVSACFLKWPLLAGLLPFCQRQIFFFLDPRVGPGYFKAFPAQSLYLASAKGKGNRQGEQD